MSQKKYADRIRFQVAKHHIQNLREQIDPNMINKIQIDKNPSQNYMNVYKSLCQDELQKTLQLHEQKKFKERQFTNQDRLKYTKAMRQQRPSNQPINNLTVSQLSRVGQRFVDYDQQQNIKKQQHVIKNYDGGQSFFKSHDQHIKRKQYESQLMNQTLKDQLQYKQYMKYMQKMQKNEQNKAFQQLKSNQNEQAQQLACKQEMNRKQLRQNIVKQIQKQKLKKQRKSTFNYQLMGRHNPITNPIQYHIDNPYILKEIQNRSKVVAPIQNNNENIQNNKNIQYYQNSQYNQYPAGNSQPKNVRYY